MIDKIKHYSITSAPSVYDEEALTALELAGRTAGKVNEVVDGFNGLVEDFNELEASVPGQIENEVQKHIDNGGFLDQINEYIGDLEGRVDNLLGSIDEGSTTFDAEIIDARMGADGLVRGNLGSAIREQFNTTIHKRATTVFDANEIKDIGFYFVSSSDGWKNVPDAGGLLVVYFGNAMTRLYQIFVSYVDGSIHTRTHDGTAFKEWVNTGATGLDSLKNDFNFNTLKLKLDLTNGTYTNVDDVKATGFYSFGSGQTLTNLPAGVTAGLLFAFKGLNPSLIYQWCHSYSGDMYYRNTDTTGKYNAWKKVGEGSSSSVTTVVKESLYTLMVLSSDMFVISRHGINGKVNYTFEKVTDSSNNTTDLWRLTQCSIIDLKNSTARSVFTRGHDVEGVLKINGTYYGGVHGYESGYSFNLNANGTLITDENISDYIATEIECDKITIYTESELYKEPLEDEPLSISFSHYKHTTFDANGVHIRNTFDFLGDDVTLDCACGAMLSVNNDCFTHYQIPESESEPYRLYFTKHVPSTTSKELDAYGARDITFAGKEIYIRHWTEDEGETLLQDYTNRVKSYFNSHTDKWLSPSSGEPTVIHTHNHFEIIY